VTMNTRLLKWWKLVYKVSRLETKFFTLQSAYRTSLGDLFFCLFIKHHHLYETIKLECDVVGCSCRLIWRKEHPLHAKYAPSYRVKSRFASFLNHGINLDFASMYPVSLIKIDTTINLSEDISKIGS